MRLARWTVTLYAADEIDLVAADAALDELDLAAQIASLVRAHLDSREALAGVRVAVEEDTGLRAKFVKPCKYGFYSEMAVQDGFGIGVYLTPSGEEVRVTGVYPDPEGKGYGWPDKVPRGEVTKWVRTERMGRSLMFDSLRRGR